MDIDKDLSSINKKIFALALPMAGTQFINVASGFLCMAMVAHLGHQILAASALIFPTQMTVMVIGMSVLLSLSVLIGHAYGAKKPLLIGNYLQQGWTLAIIISIIVIIIFEHIGKILIFFGQDKIIAEIIQSYFHAYVLAVFPAFFSVCNQQFGYAIHRKKLIISTSIMSVVVMLCTTYVLIFGKLGMPKLGIQGLGYGAAIQTSFFFLFTTSYFYFEKSFKIYDLFNYRVHHAWEHFVQMFKISWPITLQMGGEMLSFFTCAAMVGWLGTVSLAAYQVVNQYLFLILIPVFSLSQATGILIGHACGSGQHENVKKIGYVSMRISLLMAFVFAMACLLIPKKLAMLYLNVNDPSNAPVVHLIVILFAIIAFSQSIDGVRNILIGALRGLFGTKFPMLIGLLSLWVIGIPLSYFLAFLLHFGIVGILLGSMTGMLIGTVILMHRWRAKTRALASNFPQNTL